MDTMTHPIARILGLNSPIFNGMKPFVHPKRYPLKDRISISFSGGKTSAYMTKMLLDYFRQHEPWREIVVTFANTGQEHEETLKFVERCDKEFGFGVVWLEAVVNPKARKATGFRVVNFETASRKGEPFEDVIKKYGIPNKMYNHCTRETKLQPMIAYYDSIGWKYGDYSVAIGIRADEIDRVSAKAMSKGAFYPCVDAGVTKEDVRQWWLEQRFNLNIPEHLGNCTWCWKKSIRKLMTLTQSHPEIFEFPRRMEAEHAMSGGKRRDGSPKTPRTFFRENNSVESLFARAAEGNFVPFEDDKFIPFDEDLDVGGSCGDSCEIYSDQD
jgi:hypothetical protein